MPGCQRTRSGNFQTQPFLALGAGRSPDVFIYYRKDLCEEAGLPREWANETPNEVLVVAPLPAPPSRGREALGDGPEREDLLHLATLNGLPPDRRDKGSGRRGATRRPDREFTTPPGRRVV